MLARQPFVPAPAYGPRRPVCNEGACSHGCAQVNERVDYKLLHAELQTRMDTENERASHLEVALTRKEEELGQAMQVRGAPEPGL